jgi:hypothetical protein
MKIKNGNIKQKSIIIGSPGEGIIFNIKAMDVNAEVSNYSVYAITLDDAISKLCKKKLFFMECVKNR